MTAKKKQSQKLLKSLGDIWESHIDQAQEPLESRSPGRWLSWSAAACLCLAAAVWILAASAASLWPRSAPLHSSASHQLTDSAVSMAQDTENAAEPRAAKATPNPEHEFANAAAALSPSSLQEDVSRGSETARDWAASASPAENPGDFPLWRQVTGPETGKENVELTLVKAEEDRLIVSVRNNGSEELGFGLEYHVDYWEQGNWYRVYSPEYWHALGILLKPGASTEQSYAIPAGLLDHPGAYRVYIPELGSCEFSIPLEG